MIVGTAGHIDHGKTSLVRALTGVDTDRLKEEKARGISIDLGFAYLPAPDGSVLGFVDVPGHEKFVHNMLAGATGIDFVLLVIAADDGVMPQTREHLAIIDLLGIERGLVASDQNRSGCAGATGEGRGRHRKACWMAPALRDAEIVPVSTVTGDGIDDLRDRLFDAARTIRARAASERFRLAVDRSFTLPGTGTVVTGTVLSGAMSAGDRVVDQPVRARRARAFHPRAEPADRAWARRPALRAQSCRRRRQQGCHRARRGGARSRSACADRPDRCDFAAARERDKSRSRNGCRCACITPPPKSAPASCCLAMRRSCPAAKPPVQLVLDQPIAAAAGDRFVVARHHGAAHHRRRKIPRSARARAQAPHAGAAGAVASAMASATRSRHSRPC